MLKHFVLTLNPQAKFDWERCMLQNPISADQPTLAHLIAQAVGGQAGSYLVAVQLDVTVLERNASDNLSGLSETTPDAFQEASEHGCSSNALVPLMEMAA